MELFIEIKDGKPIGHPIYADNFSQVFPSIDTNNLPACFAKFVKGAPPEIGVYEVYVGAVYEKRGDVVTEVHRVRPMTSEEIIAKQNAIKERWAASGDDSWSFNESTCSFDPPADYPNDGKKYLWDKNTMSWVEVI